jgi:hypothetical protein
MLEIKSLAIQANRNPSTIFKGISERSRTSWCYTKIV